jgi:quercetin dioxygenase-like cupin family protein
MHVVNNPLGGTVTYWIRGEESAGALTVFESVVAAGQGPPLHLHTDAGEFVYVVEGTLQIRVGEVLDDAPPGTFVFIPRGVAHTWQTTGTSPTRFLFGFTPASPGMERFFEHAAGFEAEVWVAAGFARFAEDARMEILGPPLAPSDC